MSDARRWVRHAKADYPNVIQGLGLFVEAVDD